jgi:hypothetical protein
MGKLGGEEFRFLRDRMKPESISELRLLARGTPSSVYEEALALVAQSPKLPCECDCHREVSCGFYHCYGSCCDAEDVKWR